MKNVCEALACWALRYPEATALVLEGQTRTWQELDDRTARFARGLLDEHGLSVGSRVGLLAYNSLEYCEIVLASLYAGLVVVPLNVSLSANEIADQVTRAGATVLFIDAAANDKAQAVRDDTTAAVVTIGSATFEDSYGGGRLDGPELVGERAAAAIIYTSGTTGYAKGATLSHGNLRYVGDARRYADQQSGSASRMLFPLSLATTAGMGNLIPAVLLRNTLILQRRYSPQDVLDTIVSEHVTSLGGPVIIFEEVAALSAFETADLSHFVDASTGGAPVDPDLLRTWHRKGVIVKQGWGQTEAAAYVTGATLASALAQPGAAGFPFPGCRVRAVTAAGEVVEPGTEGELQVSGDGVMLGYWEDDAATANVLHDGWLSTGDLGRIDADGNVWIVGRVRDLIISGGYNVYPAEIEACITEVDGVVQVGVIGVAHPRFGEAPLAYVYGRDDLTEAAIRVKCERDLARYKQPTHIVISSEPLPTSEKGGILKKELRARASTDGLGDGSDQATRFTKA